MGLFSGQTVITVNTSTQRVVKDKDLVDSARMAVTNSFFLDDDLSDSLTEALLQSVGTRVDRLYDYTAKGLPFGLPSGEIYSSTQGYGEVQAVVNTLEGGNAPLSYYKLGPKNLMHLAWMVLISGYGYDPATNKLTVTVSGKTKEAYLKDMVIEVPAAISGSVKAKSLEIWGKSANSGYLPLSRTLWVPDGYANTTTSATPTVLNADTSQVRAKVSAVYLDNLDVVGFSTPQPTEVDVPPIYLNLDFSVDDLDFIHAKYTKDGKTKYFLYQLGLGTYPTLDALAHTPEDVFGEFYPNVYFRANRTDLSADKTKTDYTASKKQAKYLGIDYDAINKSIHENSNVGNIEQAFITLGVPDNSTDPTDLMYLYDFFDDLNARQVIPSGLDINNYINRWILANVGVPPDDPEMGFIQIKDKANNMVLAIDQLNKTRKVGKLGELGQVFTEETVISYTLPATDGGEPQVIALPVKLFKRQVSLNFYDEIQVVNLSMRYAIFNEYCAVKTTLGKDYVLIPVDRGIIDQYSSKDRERLVLRSLHFVFNSKVVTHLAWYETEIFGTLLRIVGVVLTLISLGQDGGFFSNLMSAIGAGAYQAAITLILNGLFEMFLKTLAFKLFVRVVGPQIAILVALFIALKAFIEVAGADWRLTASAKDLLTLSNGLTSGVSSFVKDSITGVQKALSALSAEKEAMDKALETAEDLLDNHGLLNPFTIIGEYPEDYYKRTIHSGNIGTLLLDDVHSYVERSLQLPTFASSVGGISYG